MFRSNSSVTLVWDMLWVTSTGQFYDFTLIVTLVAAQQGEVCAMADLLTRSCGGTRASLIVSSMWVRNRWEHDYR